MKLNELKYAEGARKNRKRVGRGPSAGQGQTAGRGTKGHKARAGGTTPPYYQGGQLPIYRKLPKKGFSNAPFKKIYQVVNVGDLNRFSSDVEITPEVLLKSRLIKKSRVPVKILGNGDVTLPLTVKAHAFSESAITKLTEKGGKAEVIQFESGKNKKVEK